MRVSLGVASFAVVLAMVGMGCGDDDGGGGDVDSGPMGVDSGPMTVDSGPRPDTGPRPDAGPGDPCATDEPLTTIGCNGGVLGPQPDNEFGGSCTPDSAGRGTCLAEDAFCWSSGAEGTLGVCIQPCTPSDSTYVSTGDPPCPMGSRCFALDGASLCFPDCNGPMDCSNGECDGEASCVGGGDPPPPGDAGPPVPDAGPLPDSGVTLPDAGMSMPDAGMGMAGVRDIDMMGTAFVPSSITIPVGTMVRWTNRDAVTHTTTSDTGAWDSGFLTMGMSFTRTFDTAGSFPYHCDIHPSMTGTITVMP